MTVRKRLALVTGGTRGIGAATSRLLLEKGYVVVANYARNDEAAAKFKTETGVETYKWDVTDFQACRENVARIEASHGPVDVLVNNAGITRDVMLRKMAQEDWARVIDTNLTSCFNMARAVIEGMRERGFGRIISISSINGQVGQLGQVNYSAAKAGVFGFTKALAREAARKGVTVNAVAPGYIRTEMTESVPEKAMESIVSQIPVGRLGEPEEIARCVVFLAADEAGFITGETISANGGHYME